MPVLLSRRAGISAAALAVSLHADDKRLPRADHRPGGGGGFPLPVMPEIITIIFMRGAPVFCLLLLALAPQYAAAGPARVGPIEAELIAEQTAIVPGDPFWIGLRLKMDPGWHTYWANPGDSGLPTTITWELPAGFSAGPIHWPYPRVLDTLGVATYGYEGEVVLQVRIIPPADLRAGSNTDLRAKVNWLACQTECIPGGAELLLNLPVRPEKPLPDARWAELFRAQRARLPREDPAVRFSARVSRKEVRLQAEGLPEAGPFTAYFFAQEQGLVSSSAPQEARRHGSLLALRLPRGEPGSEPPARLQGVLVAPDGGKERAILVDVPLQRTGTLAAFAGGSQVGFLIALLFAFFGGILLNLMPCVLPVLSLKLIGFVQKAHSSQRDALLHSLVFAAGVVLSFWLIVGLLLALRAGGQTLGWGFQFQNPGVIVVVAALFFLLGLNLFGVFEVGVGLAALGSGLQARRGWAGSFFSGFLATAVATPCTAPFMGSALGYALSQPPAVVFAVFTALALGMSVPYVVLSAFPALMKRIPRPGRWMETLKHVMGFPLMGTVVWMGSVLAALSGAEALVALLGALVICALAAWMYGRWGGIDRALATRIVVSVLAALLVVGGVAFAIRSAPAAAQAQEARAVSSTSTGITWRPYSPELVEELRTQGRRVFIDFSAKWCLTCQVNERVALRAAPVERRFRELDIVAIKADWTDRNDLITRAIAGYGRAGVPLYVLYGKDAEQPVLLPEILTPGIVLAALSKLP
jgi:thiol:disulfide interchange protein DsbD